MPLPPSHEVLVIPYACGGKQRRAVGETLGWALGWTDGEDVGAAVGPVDGMHMADVKSEGNKVDAPVDIVGAEVGRAVGAEDGADVREPVIMIV